MVVICTLGLAGLLWLSAEPVGRPVQRIEPTSAPSGSFLINDVQLFDGETLWPSADVRVDAGLIVEVANTITPPKGLPLVDGRGKTLLPGLIDAHVHSLGDARRQMLRFGVTSALDMFTDAGQLPGFKRDRESLASADQADVWSAGSLVTARGGHGTQFGVAIDTLDDAAQAASMVASRLAAGSDFIKFVVDDGHAYSDQLDLPTLDAQRVNALLQATEAAGTMAVAHVASVDAGVAVTAAGAAGLVHVFSDRVASAQEIAALAAADVFVIPTLSVVAGLSGASPGAQLADDPLLADWLDPAQLASLRAAFPPLYQCATHLQNGRANVAALQRAGVAVLAGTDAGNPGTAQGVSLHGELQLLVEAGLSPTEALRAATSLPAARFGLHDRGRIAVGLRADLLLVDGDPLQRIEDTRRIEQVWKNGHAVVRTSREAGATTTPALAALHSRFEQDGLQASHGLAWSANTDQMMGGRSVVRLQRRTQVNAANDHDAWLEVSGTLTHGAPYPWAGAMLAVRASSMEPADARALSEIRLRLRGTPRPLMVMLIAGDMQGGVPPMQRIEISAEWREYRLPLADFAGADLQRLRGVAITAGLPVGDFTFELDDFELR